MKKTFVILTIVLAILAAPVFAEVTASGEVDFQWAFNADDYAEKIDSNDMVLDLGGMVGDYTSIKAEFEGEYKDKDGSIGDGDVKEDGNVALNDATLTQDITGALGIDSPVSVSLTFGVSGVGDDPVNYNEIAGYGDMSSDGQVDPGSIMTKASFGIDTITADFSIWEDKNYAAEVYGNVADAADVSVYYYTEAVSDWEDFLEDLGDANTTYTIKDAYVFGLNGAADVIDGVTVGAGMEMFAFDKIYVGSIDVSDDAPSSFTQFGVSASYTMDALTAGLGVNGIYFEDTDLIEYKMAEKTNVAVNVNYMVNDMTTVFAAMAMPLDSGDADTEDVFNYEAGAKLAVDGVTYIAGYTLGSDYEAYAAGFMDKEDRAGNFFVKVAASF